MIIKTFKEVVPQVYTIYANTPHHAYWLVRYKGRLVWRTIDQIKDVSDMICIQFDNNTPLNERVNQFCYIVTNLKNRKTFKIGKYTVQLLPNDVDDIQISESTTSMEDGHLWDETISYELFKV